MKVIPFLLAGCLSWGQIPLSIDEAVRIAKENHPLLRERQERQQAASALTSQAALRPNPRLIIQSENWSFTGAPQQSIPTFTDQFLYLSQVIETKGKRQRRTDFAEAATALAGLDRDLLERQIVARVKFAYWSALGTQQILELWREDEQTFAQTIQYHVDRTREGALPEADLLKVRLEGGRVSLAATAAALEADRARIDLLREMAQPETTSIQLTTHLPEVLPAVMSPDTSAPETQRMEGKLARQLIAQAKANLDLQRSLAKPDVELIAGYKRTGGYNTALWGVQFNLPFQNKNQGNIAAANSSVRAAEYSLTAVENQIRSEVLSARRDVESKRGQLEGLLATSLRQAEESVQIARAAYQEGGTDLLRLLDAERVHIEIEVLNVRTQMEYQQSLVALETALGNLP